MGVGANTVLKFGYISDNTLLGYFLFTEHAACGKVPAQRERMACARPSLLASQMLLHVVKQFVAERLEVRHHLPTGQHFSGNVELKGSIC